MGLEVLALVVRWDGDTPVEGPLVDPGPGSGAGVRGGRCLCPPESPPPSCCPRHSPARSPQAAPRSAPGALDRAAATEPGARGSRVMGAMRGTAGDGGGTGRDRENRSAARRALGCHGGTSGVLVYRGAQGREEGGVPSRVHPAPSPAPCSHLWAPGARGGPCGGGRRPSRWSRCRCRVRCRCRSRSGRASPAGIH